MQQQIHKYVGDSNLSDQFSSKPSQALSSDHIQAICKKSGFSVQELFRLAVLVIGYRTA